MVDHGGLLTVWYRSNITSLLTKMDYTTTDKLIQRFQPHLFQCENMTQINNLFQTHLDFRQLLLKFFKLFFEPVAALTFYKLFDS